MSAAADHGVPSVYVESGGGGNLRQADLDAYVEGTLRVMRMLGMVDEAPAGSFPARAGRNGWSTGRAATSTRGSLRRSTGG